MLLSDLEEQLINNMGLSIFTKMTRFNFNFILTL